MISPILPLYDRANIDFTHGKGMYLYDKSNKKYIDFAAGYAAMAFGHCHPKLVETIQQQAEKLWHISNRFKIPGLYEYSKRLCDNTFADTAFIANSGAEAVECMIKMCRRYFNEQGKKDKFHIITFEGAFHGRTLATASAGAAEKIIGFEPAVQGFHRVPFQDLNAIKKAINKNTAGILFEPIQGEGGMHAHDEQFVKDLRALCDQEDILLLADEIQCGMGRTGWLTACQMYGIKPDLMALGKGLGSGYPISACLATERVGKAMKSGTHGSTFGGNPMAVAIGTTVLDEMLAPEFLPRVKEISKYLRDKLDILAGTHPLYIDEIRGSGLMMGIKFKPAIDNYKFTDLCVEHGLLTIPASDNVIRLTPPLIIEREHIDEGLEIIHNAIIDYGKPLNKIKRGIKTVIKKLIS
ncbi:MAG: aspartate aminotransferase family protein [Rickettsiales bacterium]